MIPFMAEQGANL